MTDIAPVETTGTVDRPAEEPTIGQLVASASRDVSTLVQHEIALAKAELKVSIKNGGLGAALFAAAGFVSVLAVIMVSFGIVYLIHLSGLNLAWCYLIVFGFYLIVAGILAAIGINRVKVVRPPERAIHQAQETADVLRHRG